MLTIDKAIRLLDFFDESRPEIGLSEMSRISGLDKATTHRVMTSLARHGLLEQHPKTRAYRLGVGLLRLARIREATFPVEAVIQPLLASLTSDTDETSHLSLLTGSALSTVGVVESPRLNRVFVEPGLRLPLHATASGLAFLAASSDDVVERLLSADLAMHPSPATPTSVQIQQQLKLTRERGFATADQTFEAEVYGIAVALWGPDAKPNGAVAVATPISRMDETRRESIACALHIAASEITQALGGRAPDGHPHNRQQAA